jgi:hypothetical protein
MTSMGGAIHPGQLGTANQSQGLGTSPMLSKSGSKHKKWSNLAILCGNMMPQENYKELINDHNVNQFFTTFDKKKDAKSKDRKVSIEEEKIEPEAKEIEKTKQNLA